MDAKGNLRRVLNPSVIVSLREKMEEIQKELEDHIADKDNPHEVTSEQVGLGNVDNTSDMDKPVSTAVQEAIDAEQTEREGADAELLTLISTEQTAREDADAELLARIEAIEPGSNTSPTVWVGDIPLYGATFVDVAAGGRPILREDGRGEHLIHVTILLAPLLRHVYSGTADIPFGQAG